MPSFKYVELKHARELLNLGMNFFLIRIASVVLFMSSSFLIAHLFSPKEVTSYQIAHKYFQIILMCFFIALAPLWSAVTDAYFQNDFKWITNSVKKLLKLWGGVVVITILPVAIASNIDRG